MKNFTTIVVSGALLLGASQIAWAQEGEGEGEGEAEVGGEVSGEVNASGTAEVSADSSANATASSASSVGGSTAGPLGFGGAIVPSGVGGLEVTYHVSDKLMINGLLAFASYSPDQGDSSTTIGFAASGFLNLFDKGWADLFVGGRLGFVSGTTEIETPIGNVSADTSMVLIEIPLRIQLQLHRRLAIHFETGLAIDLVSFEVGNNSTDSTIFIFGANGSDVFATGGFTLYL